MTDAKRAERALLAVRTFVLNVVCVELMDTSKLDTILDFLPKKATRARRAFIEASEGVPHEISSLCKTANAEGTLIQRSLHMLRAVGTTAWQRDVLSFVMEVEEEFSLLLVRLILVSSTPSTTTMVLLFQVSGYPVGCDLHDDYACLAAIISLNKATKFPTRFLCAAVTRLEDVTESRRHPPFVTPPELKDANARFRAFAWVNPNVADSGTYAYEISRQHLFIE